MNDNRSMNSRQWISLLGLSVLMIAALAGVFLLAPAEKVMGDSQRIFYFHVSSAWVGFLGFGVSFVSSLAYLATRRMKWDWLALASAELGVLFCAIVMVTGPIWAKKAWGVYWVWDPRLTTTLILWLIYIGYLLVRTMISDPHRRAVTAAAVAIIGFVDVPIVYMSIRWWRTLHPAPVLMGGEDSGLNDTMKMVFFFSLFTFTMLYWYLVVKRTRLAKAESELDRLYRQLG